jgi:predicted ATPase
LQIALGGAYVAVGGYGAPQAIVAYTRVKTLCAELNVPLSPPTLRALALISLSAPNVAEASIWAEQLLQLSQREGDPFLLAEAHYMVGVVCFWRAEFIHAKSHLEQALAYYDPGQLNQHIRLYGQDLRVICLARLALTLWYLGYPEQALQMVGEARRDAHTIGHPVTLAYALCFASWVYNDCGDLAASEEAAQQLLTLARELSLVWWQAAGSIFYGWIEVQRGNAQAGQVEINHGIEVYHTTGQNTYRPYMLSLLAQSYQHLDDPQAALHTVEDALEFSAQTGHCFWDGELYRLQGEFSSLLGLDASQVEALYVKALKLAHHQQAKSLELRAAMRLCRLWQQQAQAERARLLLAQVYNQFTEGFDLPELRAAAALLDELKR